METDKKKHPHKNYHLGHNNRTREKKVASGKTGGVVLGRRRARRVESLKVDTKEVLQKV